MITDKANENLKFTENKIDVSLLILGDSEYTPTQLQTQTLLAYLQDDQALSPAMILDKSGHHRDNWFKWLTRYPNFLAWWNRTIERVFTDQRLNDLYQALYRRGLTHDTRAVKLLMQRFDPKYTERSSQDQRLAFAGYEPGMVEDSKERMRLAVAEEQQGTHKALPAAPVAEQGPGHSLPAPEPAQAQTPSQQHVIGMDAVLDKDNIIDSEPISKESTPGGGFGE